VGKILAEIALRRLQSEIIVALFRFASRSLLANNLCFMVKLIDKTIVINVKIHKNERKRLYSSNKENYLVETKVSQQISKFVLTKFPVKI
jgi:hypothetical protein